MTKTPSNRLATARSRKVRSSKPQEARLQVRKPSRANSARADKQKNAASKQSRLIAMLQGPEGTTIAAMMQTTGWQQHSVRGFLAGVVRKKLKLKLVSNKANDKRIYWIKTGGRSDNGAPQPNPGSV